MRPKIIFCLSLSILASWKSVAYANGDYNLFGLSGLIDTPNARVADDAELGMTYARTPESYRVSVAFQLAPKISGAFRYARLGRLTKGTDDLFDRSFDIHYQIFDEQKSRPAVAVGLRDFLGTSVYSSEYIVATKSFGDRFEATAGLGWGRLSGQISQERVEGRSANGGKFQVQNWFVGPVSPFAGIKWQTPIDRLSFKMEYSPDLYARENALSPPTFNRRSDLNFGLEYASKANFDFGLYSFYGSEIAFRISTSMNPNASHPAGYVIPAPLHVLRRDPTKIDDLTWLDRPDVEMLASDLLNETLAKEGIAVEKIALSAHQAHVQISDRRNPQAAMSFGRTARAMSHIMPESIDTFKITSLSAGQPSATLTLDRTDFENLENSENATSESASKFSLDSPKFDDGENFVASDGFYPKFQWSISPYLRLVLFGGGDQGRAFFYGGIQGSASYAPSPGLKFAGRLQQPLGHDNSFDPPGFSGLPRVRTNIDRYRAEGNPALTKLYGNYNFKLDPDLYGRVSAGIFEQQYGGLSAEILYKRPDQRWAIGAELNYVRQREFEQLLRFQDYTTWTGHASLYYEFKNGYDARIHVGRYLAGDTGATIEFARTFDNGWEVGAYATFTNVSASDFGEGSFDKGLRITIPLNWALGTQTKQRVTGELVSLTRDGGARVKIPDRLYDSMREYHIDNVSGTLGAFWK